MIGLLVLAQATVIAPAATAATAVPATAWRCRLTDASGATSEHRGTIPALAAGRDPNRLVFADHWVDQRKDVAGITGEPGGPWLRDYQLTWSEGEATLVLNLRLRRDSDGIAWLTRYDPSLGALRQPYRYLAAGLCAADFAPSAASNP